MKGLGFYVYQPRLIDMVRIAGFELVRPVNSNSYGFFGGGRRKGVDSSQIYKRFVYMDSAGIGRTVPEMENLCSTHGRRFEPGPILVA
ncbi:MAG: hypothetical protein WAN11_07550 [Syntrophobacteraceae bacterium]